MKNNKGFSLVELMVVVAIIGILAAVAIPNFQRFQRKAKQSEGKTLLGGYYTAEKAFYAEWQDYGGEFDHIGFSPEGQLKYRVKSGNGVPTAITGYTAAVTLADSGLTDSTTWCADARAKCTDTATAILKNAVLATATVSGANCVVAADTFLATVQGFIGGASDDEWSINEKKLITIIQDGVRD